MLVDPGEMFAVVDGKRVDVVLHAEILLADDDPVVIKSDREAARQAGLSGAEVDRLYGPTISKLSRRVTKDAHDDDLARRTEEILASLDLGDLMDIVEALQPDLEEIAADAAAEAIATVGLADDQSIVDVVNERAVLAAQDQAASLVGMRYDEDGNLVEAAREAYRIDEATRDMLRDTIADGLAENIGTDAIADLIENDYAFSEERADLIARTEVTNANSAGALASYQEARDAGVELRKEWLLGPNPCEVCQENADAGPIDLDDEFPSGDMHPAAHPRCECAVSPVVAEEGDEAQAGGEDDGEKFAKYSDDRPRDVTAKSAPRLAQSAADYVDQSPSDTECCHLCTMYTPTPDRTIGACTAVAGAINRRGWCRLFEPA